MRFNCCNRKTELSFDIGCAWQQQWLSTLVLENLNNSWVRFLLIILIMLIVVTSTMTVTSVVMDSPLLPPPSTSVPVTWGVVKFIFERWISYYAIMLIMSRHLKDESPVSCVLTFTVNWGLCTFGYYQRRIFRKYPLPTIVARREQVLHWHRQVRWACWQQRDGQVLRWSSMWSGFRYRDRRQLLSLATPGEDRHCHHHCHHMRPHGHNRHR